jgi:hypothetical protein
MRRAVLALVALMAIAVPVGVGATLVSANPASAVPGDNTCSRADFHKVHRGDTLTKVRRLCGKGTQEYFFGATYFSNAAQTRKYSTAGRWSSAYVDFEKKAGVWRVTSKWAFWA